MKMYNTLSKTIDELKPLSSPIVTVYTCGPTVYDYAHIGHWFTYIRADMLIRTLKLVGFKPKWVMNITDVGHLVSDADDGEDKLEKGAKREGKKAWEVAEFYTRDFLTGMKQLNILEPDHIVKATEHIAEQISLIQKLETKGFTYVIDDGVYFDTSKFPSYANFARLNLEEQQAGARVAVNPEKRNQTDFALWKFSPKDSKRDMEWDSPWGKGFPGWHIECSAMSMKYLGETLDIHTGGIDHIPVHHTNEIAQSESATGKQFSKMWMHSNHVMVEGEKISKSLGNGIRLQEIMNRGISPEAIRLHVLESHYRSQAKFSWENLEAAANRLKDLQAMSSLRWQAREGTTDSTTIVLKEVPAVLISTLADDLNTPQLLSYLSEVSRQTQTILIDQDSSNEFNNLADFVDMLKFVDETLGLNLMSIIDISEPQKEIITNREVARTAQDWTKSDELRKKLVKQGIGLRDTSSGPIWYPL